MLFPDDLRVDDNVVWIRCVAVVDCFEKADVVVDELVIEVVDEIGLVENVEGGDTEVFVEVVEFFNGWEDKVEVVNIEEK